MEINLSVKADQPRVPSIAKPDRGVLKRKFMSGFLSVFRFGRVPIKNRQQDGEILTYVSQVCEDINVAYCKLKEEYERK